MLLQTVGLAKSVLYKHHSRDRTTLIWFYEIYVWHCHCGPICFNFGMKLYTTKLYSLIPVWMALLFTQGHRVARKLEPVQSLCWKVAWSSSNVCDGGGGGGGMGQLHWCYWLIKIIYRIHALEIPFTYPDCWAKIIDRIWKYSSLICFRSLSLSISLVIIILFTNIFRLKLSVHYILLDVSVLSCKVTH